MGVRVSRLNTGRLYYFWPDPAIFSKMETTPKTINEQQAEQRLKPRGKPWPPGTSGNPAGRPTMSKRVAALYAALANEHGEGSTLSVVNQTLLLQACKLIARGEQTKEAADAVKCLNAARRLLAGLKLDVAKSPRRALGPFGRSLQREPGTTP
jgi:hypothetical protein